MIVHGEKLQIQRFFFYPKLRSFRSSFSPWTYFSFLRQSLHEYETFVAWLGNKIRYVNMFLKMVKT